MCMRLLFLARPSLSPLLPAVLLLALFAWFSPAAAEVKAEEAPATKNAKAEELPPEELVDLITRDGVILKASFYAGTKGRDSVPVVLLHMYDGSRKDYARLASFLQEKGHAVLVPDLRGHGDSTQVQGSTVRLETKSMPPQAFNAMVTGDMEACKKFLVDKNNDGKLNIEKLCLVGAEMGSVVAMEYARLDWSWPPLVTGKQGQDVKAVVLLSPQWSFRTLQVRPLLNQPAVLRNLATMILVGKEDHRSLREAKRLYSTLKRSHPSVNAKNMADRTLLYLPLATSLQGTKMLDEPTLHVQEWIASFIKVRLADKTFPWKKRTLAP
ncbi:MAG: alpha/beta fold hydrolase [Pirellulales bacterium]|nr:alpha/beta fold hydrolase [Pirellulales bacterium]